MSRRVGVLGGTFDPPHVGHVVVARDARERLGLDEVRLMVAARSPHKRDVETAPGELRARMVEASVRDEDGLTVDRTELERGGVSYTVDTLSSLRTQEPEVEWSLLLGADQFADFGRWREPVRVGRLASLVVLTREGVDPEELETEVDVAFRTLRVTRLDVSSTEIRKRIREGRSVRWLVPEPARRIMKDAGLYSGR